MRDFWDNIPYLTLFAFAGFFLYTFGQAMQADIEQSQVRYEQCIAAGKQWIEGSCVK